MLRDFGQRLVACLGKLTLSVHQHGEVLFLWSCLWVAGLSQQLGLAEVLHLPCKGHGAALPSFCSGLMSDSRVTHVVQRQTELEQQRLMHAQ